MRDSGESFSRKLRLLRLAEGITQQELASELGISRSCLANYELGARQPDHDMLNRIADRFNVLTDYLMCRTDLTNLPVQKSEMEELLKVSCRVNKLGDSIDISGASISTKVAIIEFCKFVMYLDAENKEHNDK